MGCRRIEGQRCPESTGQQLPRLQRSTAGARWRRLSPRYPVGLCQWTTFTPERLASTITFAIRSKLILHSQRTLLAGCAVTYRSWKKSISACYEAFARRMRAIPGRRAHLQRGIDYLAEPAHVLALLRDVGRRVDHVVVQIDGDQELSPACRCHIARQRLARQ